MASTSHNSKFASRVALSIGLAFGAVTAPSLCLAAGPGGFAFGLKATVERVVKSEAAPFAGVSDPVNLRSIDNINTRGFALRRDGAY